METPAVTTDQKLSVINRKLGVFVVILSGKQSDHQLFATTLELLLKQTELLRHESTFLKLVCVAKEDSANEKSTLTTDLTPKNFILYLLEISKSFLHASNEDTLRNVIQFLTFVFSLGPPLPPVDKYFDSSAKKNLPSYDNLLRNVKTPVQLFQTDHFLNQFSADVTHIFTEGQNLIGGDIAWVDMVVEACRLSRGYDPFMHSFDTPVANLFKLPILLLSQPSLVSSSHRELGLRLVAASPSLYIELDESPQPKLRTLVTLLREERLHTDTCLAMTSSLYRLFVVSEQNLDACLDEDLIGPLMEDISFLIRRHIEGGQLGDQLLRMVFQLLKSMTLCEESKIVIAGQPSIIMECTNLVQECRSQSVFAVGFLFSVCKYLSHENLSLVLKAISNCSRENRMFEDFGNYFSSVVLQLCLLHGLVGNPGNGLSPKEFVDISSRAILKLTDSSVFDLGLKILRELFDFQDLCGIVSEEFIGAFTKLFLESVRLESEDLIGLFSQLICEPILGICDREGVDSFKNSNLDSEVVRLFTSEERCEYLTHYSKILKFIVSSYSRERIEFVKFRDYNLLDKLTGLLLGIHSVSQESGSDLFDIQSDCISILWALSCDSSYFTVTFQPANTVTTLTQLLRNEISNLDSVLVDSYAYRGAAHVISNIAVSDAIKMEIAATGLHTELFMTLLQLSELSPLPWSLLDATLRILDASTADEVYRAELVEFGLLEQLLHILLLQPDDGMMLRILDILNSCAGISADYRHTMCTEALLGYCVDLLMTTNSGGVFCICCCLLATLSDSQSEARYVSGCDILPRLLSSTEDSDLNESCKQVRRWSCNLVDKVFLSSVSVTVDMTSSLPGHRAELSSLREGHFVVDRMMGLVRQGCMDCETREKDSCTLSESLSAEEICLYSSSLSLSQYQQLVNRGWYRRGGDRMYRWEQKLAPECVNWETRVRVSEFSVRERKSFSRILKKIPKDLTVTTVPARFTEEGYNLYNEYHLHKHSRGRVSKESYICHVVETCVPAVSMDGVDYGTFHQEYRVAGELIGIGVIDVIPEGVVSIYFYYKTSRDVLKLSLGKFSSLKEIFLTQDLNSVCKQIRYYYLQGWSEKNKKLSYKADYKPVEFLARCVHSDWTENPQIDKDSQLSSLQIDKSDWLRTTFPLSVNSIKVYVNGMLITFQQLLSVAKLGPQECTYITSSLEQMCYAIGSELTSNLILHFDTSQYFK